MHLPPPHPIGSSPFCHHHHHHHPRIKPYIRAGTKNLLLYRKMSVFRKLDLSFNASLWLLYSITVSAGKLRTFLMVSLQQAMFIRHVADFKICSTYLIFKLILPLDDVLFHTEMISSELRIDNTAPQISSLTSNCSPMIASTLDRNMNMSIYITLSNGFHSFTHQ